MQPNPKERDEQGRFVSPLDVVRYSEITVWDLINGDVVKVVRDATDRQLQEIEEQYCDEPGHNIQIEEI